MAVKWTTKINRLPNVAASMKSLHGKSVEVGCPASTAWLAGIHEYG